MPEGAHPRESWHSLSQQLQPFGGQIDDDDAHAGDVPAWLGDASHKPEADGIGDTSKDDGDRLGRVLGRPGRWRANRHDRVDLEAHQVGSKAWRELVLSRRVAALKGPILPFHPPKVVQRFRESLSGGLRGRPRREGWRLIQEESDAGDLPPRCASAASGSASRLRMRVTMHPTALYHIVVSLHEFHAALFFYEAERWRSAAPGSRSEA